MTPDDPRHGTNAGYQTHWREGEQACEPCKAAKRRRQKLNRYDTHRGVPMKYTADTLENVIGPWLRMGIPPSSIATAAGFENQRGSNILHVLHVRGNIRRGTLKAYAQVTEDDFPDHTYVYADLTRQRIFSLMAIGHPLTSMPVNPRSTWRYRKHVRAGTARAIRDFYRQHEFQIGTSKITQSRALNAGHKPPLSWDDPGTLAWPDGPLPTPIGLSAPNDTIDEAVVQRILSGETVRSTPAERTEVCRRWVDGGGSLNELERITGWRVHRYYQMGEAA